MHNKRYDRLADYELSSLLQGSEREPSFKALYARYGHRIYLYALAVTGSRESSEDILQETFTRFFEATSSGQVIEKVSNYLFVIARNLSITSQSQTKRIVGLEDLDLRSLESDPDRKEMATMIGLALELLDVPHREVFALRLIDVMDYSEISQITGESEQTLRKRFERAKLKVKRSLAPYYAELRQS